MAKKIVCIPKSLTAAQNELAVRRGIEINPANALEFRTVERTPRGQRGGPRRLALLIGSKWPDSAVDLSVQFLDNPRQDLRARILSHMNAWNKTADVRFRETNGIGQVRIARLDKPADMAGYWSYIGTEILGIEDDEPTLNLEGFTMRTSEAEFRRVVRHEAGHTLGFEHEHMRSDLVKKIDRRKAIAYFDETDGWSAEETELQVLTPLAKTSIMGTTESDPLSIMCYEIPAEITKDGEPILGGQDINENDFRFAARIYPKRDARRQIVQPSVKTEVPATLSLRDSEDNAFQIVVMDTFDPEADQQRSSGSESDSQIKKPTPKFAQVFASYAGARVSSAMRLRSDKGEPSTWFGEIIGLHQRIKDYTNGVRGSLPTDEELVKFGGYLFETLFQGDVRRLYDEARARQHNNKLDIVFTSMIPWIAEKPWEFAFDTVRNSFLATEEIHLVRNVLTAIPANAIPTQSGPLRILVAAAQPVGLPGLSFEQELALIRRGFETLEEAGLVTIDVVPKATPGMIHELLSTGDFNIVHFIGHGRFDESTQEGSLVFENDRGGHLLLNQRSVREVFCQRNVSLVFLNSCQSGSGGRSDFNKGVAQSLVSHGMPALVANQYSVRDLSATSFAQHFYWCLAHGMSVGQAACEARIAVNYSMSGELIDWAVPVVYARDPNLAICAKPDNVRLTKSAARRRKQHAEVRDRPVRVGVWDIDNVFPALETTLGKMNRVQSEFGFELTSASPPLGVWDLDERAVDGTPYLWAEKLAHRLEQMPVELGVNVLACITRHWLRDNDWFNLYGWWPDNKQPAVLIFSYAGFEGLATEGPETDRAIANVTVSGLAGFLGELGAHEDGAENCPLYFDESRELKTLIAQQQFDEGCRKSLKENIPKEFEALKSLLKPFD